MAEQNENKIAPTKDEEEINAITNQFFDLFTNTNNRIPNIRKMEEFFLPDGIIINNTTGEPAIYDMEGFIEPREKILTDGTLINFKEEETFHKTEIHGNIAQRTCHYKKSGNMNGELFKGKGIKLMQFIKIKDKWFLSAVTWSDKK